MVEFVRNDQLFNNGRNRGRISGGRSGIPLLRLLHRGHCRHGRVHEPEEEEACPHESQCS